VDADAIVDDVDLDQVVGLDRKPAAFRVGVAHHVGERLGDDPVGRHLHRRREWAGSGRERKVDLEVTVELARELGHGTDEAQLIERRRAQAADDPLDLVHDPVDLVGEAGGQGGGGGGGERGGGPGGAGRGEGGGGGGGDSGVGTVELSHTRAEPQGYPGERGSDPVVQVASQ